MTSQSSEKPFAPDSVGQLLTYTPELISQLRVSSSFHTVHLYRKVVAWDIVGGLVAWGLKTGLTFVCRPESAHGSATQKLSAED